jgi:hypothetical protein
LILGLVALKTRESTLTSSQGSTGRLRSYWESLTHQRLTCGASAAFWSSYLLGTPYSQGRTSKNSYPSLWRCVASRQTKSLTRAQEESYSLMIIQMSLSCWPKTARVS